MLLPGTTMAEMAESGEIIEHFEVEEEVREGSVAEIVECGEIVEHFEEDVRGGVNFTAEGELVEGIVLKDGVVVDTRHHELFDESADPWDDSVLMGIYRKSVKSHTLKGKAKDRGSKSDDKKEPLVGVPGPWIANIVQKYTTNKSQGPAEHNPESSSAHRKRQRSSSSNNDSVDVDYSVFAADDYQPAPSAGPPLSHFSLLDAAFSDMVSAWYHSGYATARYQTLKELLGEGGQTYSTGDNSGGDN